MMGGLDASFSAAIMIGYHASASSSAGVRVHTVSSATFTRIAINGQDVSEGAIGVAQAGAMGVPVVFMSGDNIAIAELRDRIGNIVTVETKRALGFHSARRQFHRQKSAARIEVNVRSALARVREFKPYVVTAPVTVELKLQELRSRRNFQLPAGHGAGGLLHDSVCRQGYRRSRRSHHRGGVVSPRREPMKRCARFLVTR